MLLNMNICKDTTIRLLVNIDMRGDYRIMQEIPPEQLL